MFKKEFLVIWLLSSVVMLGLSYTWHGVLLNDLDNQPTTFFPLLLVVYLVIGFALTFAYYYVQTKRVLKYKGLLLGAVFGFFIYLIVYVLGLSLKNSSQEYLVVFDFLWQMLEQGIGGGIIGYGFVVADRMKKLADI